MISEGARLSIKHELDVDPDSTAAYADVVYDPTDLAAAVSSGSFLTMGMVVMPCSMSTLAAVATGNTTDLLTRAADVTLYGRPGDIRWCGVGFPDAITGQLVPAKSRRRRQG